MKERRNFMFGVQYCKGWNCEDEEETPAGVFQVIFKSFCN